MSDNPYRVFAYFNKHFTGSKVKPKKKRKKASKKVAATKAKKIVIVKKTLPYIEGWSSIRKKILDRDDYCCRICCSEMSLHVHHIDSNRSNNKTTNLVTLCQPCHHQVHLERYKPWEHDIEPPWGNIE